MDLPEDLNFLKNHLNSCITRFHSHSSLISEFSDNHWFFDFTNNGKYIAQINFDIRLPDGTQLTDEQHLGLLYTFKLWIIVSLSVNKKCQLVTPSIVSLRGKLASVCKLIDYLLINDKYLKISKFGLGVLSEDNVKEIFSKICSTTISAEGVYDFKNKVLIYIRLKSKNSLVDIEAIEKKYNIDLHEDNWSQFRDFYEDIDESEVAHIKAWLFENNFYQKSKNDSPWLYHLSTVKFAEILYGKTTLWGNRIKKPSSWSNVFSIGEKEPYLREYLRVETRDTSEDECIGSDILSKFRSIFESLKHLAGKAFINAGVTVPNNDILTCVRELNIETKLGGRFKTVPVPIIFKLAEKCINFHLDYGDELLLSYENIVELIASRDIYRQANLASGTNFVLNQLFSEDEFLSCLHPKIRKIGCTKLSAGRYFSATDLRSNNYFMPLLNVYFGSTALMLGILGARRVGEILSMPHGQAFDQKNKYIIFEREKATKNIGGLRDLIARPMDELCLAMLKNLERVQTTLIRYGYLEESTFLFGTYGLTALKTLSSNNQNFYASLDKACDYFEVDVVDNHRYYIRPHQLRRFFALLFFWGSSGSSERLDTLRWFLGHTDIEHLHHYITEKETGAVLNHIKANYVSDNVNDFPELLSFICNKYSVSDVELLDKEELEDYIDYLVSKGAIEIYSEFIREADGTKHKLIVKIHGGIGE